MDDRKRINIMTSCDDNLTNYIFHQLRTIAMHLKDKEIHFFLFHNRVPKEKIEKLDFYCKCLGEIIFHEVFVDDIEAYVEFAKNGAWKLTPESEKRWPYEAYFSIGCHRYLPDDVDRILFIDAGDVLFTGGIDEFYFDDFEGKSLIMSPRIAKENWETFTPEDLKNGMLENVRKGIFNSGSYMINVEMFRKEDIPMKNFLKFIENIPEFPNETKYRTDEGLLSIVFVDKMKYFKHEEMKELWYKPYNFTMDIFRNVEEDVWKKPLWYEPIVIHFVGYMIIKPWNLIQVLVNEGVLEPEAAIEINKLLEIASDTKYGDLVKDKDDNVQNEKIRKKLETSIIEKEMIPFYRYWFEVDNLIQKDFKQLSNK